MNKFSIVSIALAGASFLLEIVSGVFGDKSTEAEIHDQVQKEVAAAMRNRPNAVLYNQNRRKGSK